MKKGFTLIELIFVIVIIGVLGAVAVPKFLNLKQNAEAANIVKTVNDAISAVPSSYVNMVDLEEQDPSTIELKNLLELKGKGWEYAKTGADQGKYTFKVDNSEVAYIQLDPNRVMKYKLTCSGFKDAKTKEKCNKLWGATNTDELSISW